MKNINNIKLKKVLIISVYYKSVGHLLEILKRAKGFYSANKNIEIHLVVNSELPYLIIEGASWIKETYLISVKDIAKIYNTDRHFNIIPKTWDYILYDDRIFRIPLSKYQELRRNKIIPRNTYKEYISFRELFFKIRKKLISKTWPTSLSLPEATDLKYFKNQQIILNLPREAKLYAKKYSGKNLKICIMLGGSRIPEMYPRIRSWIKIITALRYHFPGIQIYITGVTKLKGRKSVCGGYSRKDLAKLFSMPNIIKCYDIDIWKQVALIKACDIFLSPHTGFAFLSACVKTPWLTLSGGYMHEYFFNGVPFYSVLPGNKNYPHHIVSQPIKELKKKNIFNEMKPSVLENRIQEIIHGVRLLTDKNFNYEKAIELHLKNIKKNRLNPKSFFSFDNALGLN